METLAGSFAIAGATLAQIMHDFCSVEGDCDGLLFGRLQHQTTSNMQDDSVGPATTHEEITARVTGYYCSGRVLSFYDATGRLNHSKLSNIIRERQSRGEDPPIGWYLGRRNSSLWPSMREVAVTTHLRSGSNSPPVAEEYAANATSPSKSNVGQVGSVLGAEPSSTVTRRSPSLTPLDNIPQTGRVGGIGGAAAAATKRSVPTLEIPGSPTMSASPSRRRSDSTSSPRQEMQNEPIMENITPISPCFFMLFTESESTNRSVRTHEYRAFQSLKNPKGIKFEPLPVNIVNAGVLRGFYDSFVPVASIPQWFNSNLDLGIGAGGSPAQLRSEGEKGISGKSASLLDNNGGGKSSRSAYEDDLASLAVHESVDAKGGSRVIQFESMYQQMLTRLERLSVEACESSVALK